MMKTKRTVLPGQAGFIKWREKYGEKLLCVRYKYDAEKGKKMITVELVVTEKEWHRNKKHIPRNKLFSVKIAYGERELGQRIRSLGGVWVWEKKIWRVNWEAIQALGLEGRIVDEDAEFSNIRNKKPP